MSAEQATANRGSVAVRLDTTPIYGESAFSVFVRLREVFGETEVCLLESLHGPETDSRRAFIGVSPLLDVTVRSAEITLTGVERLVDWADARLGEFSGATSTVPGVHLLHSKDSVWDALRHLQSGFDVEVDASSFGFGFVTVFGYDAVMYIEKIPQLIDERGSDPDMVLRVYAATIDIDLPADSGILSVGRSDFWDDVDAERIVAVAAEAPAIDTTDDAAIPAPGAGIAPQFSMSTDEFLTRAEIALEHIHAGDIYQVQLGYQVTIPAERRDLDVYRRLRAINPSPYMAYIPLGESTVISGSPELHVRVEGDLLTMRPIAGTARKTSDAAANAENVAWLKQDAKEIAEHIMLVDLCRNDLGRVAHPGSVSVDSLMNVEEYSHVFHLVSTVTARMDDTADVYDVVCATFPAGTMTGAPKIRAMEIIETLEKTRRGIYAGVFGVIGFGGFTNLALSIRTIVASPEGYAARASAGVVVDSAPQSEWLETLAKMGSAVRAITNGDLL
jgi:anthranilate/para-aminobenzoate synthase component I